MKKTSLIILILCIVVAITTSCEKEADNTNIYGTWRFREMNIIYQYDEDSAGIIKHRIINIKENGSYAEKLNMYQKQQSYKPLIFSFAAKGLITSTSNILGTSQKVEVMDNLTDNVVAFVDSDDKTWDFEYKVAGDKLTLIQKDWYYTFMNNDFNFSSFYQLHQSSNFSNVSIQIVLTFNKGGFKDKDEAIKPTLNPNDNGNDDDDIEIHYITLTRGTTGNEEGGGSGGYGKWRSTDITLYETSDFCLRLGYDNDFCLRPYIKSGGNWVYQSSGYAGIFKVEETINNLSQITYKPTGEFGNERWVLGLNENEGFVVAYQATSQEERKFFRFRFISKVQDLQSVIIEYQNF